MAIVAPFKGITYNYLIRQDLAALMAPPYDVITEEEQEEYYQVDPYNVIRLILPKEKAGDSNWDNKYSRAADFFKRWETADILLQFNRPCIYLTSLTYDPGNGDPVRTRWGIIAAVRIEEADSGVILPHERTFSAHKDDRLKLMRACRAQLSQIFGLYEEPENEILSSCRRAADFPPELSFDFHDGTKHRMWILQNPRLHKKIADLMRDKTIFIADGHHRYETARNYRNIMRPRYGRKPPNRSFEFVMAYLTNMSDKGLTILPYHRLITDVPGFELESFLKKTREWFDISEHPFPGNDTRLECADIKERLEQSGELDTSIAFFHQGAEKYFLFKVKPGARQDIGDDLHPSLKELDVIVLSRFVLQQGLGFTRDELDNEERFHYRSSMMTAVSDVQSGGYEMTFLLNPTKIDHVKNIASNTLVMPRKSTFFHPKILSGLVFNKLDPHEIIQVP